MQSDVGAHLVCALHLVSEGNSGAREVRPYGEHSVARLTREDRMQRQRSG